MAATNHQKHEAGRHLAVAHALLRGYPAKLVGPHRYVEINGRSAVVMLAGKGAWQIADLEDFTASNQERYILVDVTDDAAVFYIMPETNSVEACVNGMRRLWTELVRAPEIRRASTPRSSQPMLSIGRTTGLCSPLTATADFRDLLDRSQPPAGWLPGTRTLEALILWISCRGSTSPMANGIFIARQDPNNRGLRGRAVDASEGSIGGRQSPQRPPGGRHRQVGPPHVAVSAGRRTVRVAVGSVGVADQR